MTDAELLAEAYAELRELRTEIRHLKTQLAICAEVAVIDAKAIEALKRDVENLRTRTRTAN